MDWFYVDANGESNGPITIEQIKQLQSDTNVWNGTTVKQWTQLKDIQSLMNQEDHSEYDCQFIEDEGNENDTTDSNNNLQISSEEQFTNNSNLTLATLAPFAIHNSEDIIDEELTPEPIIDEPLELLSFNPHKNTQILQESVIDIKIKNDLKKVPNTVDSPNIPFQNLEKECKDCDITAQPPMVNALQNIIECPLCTFHNNVTNVKCIMCGSDMKTEIIKMEKLDENNDLNNKMSALMNELNIPKQARVAMLKLPKQKKCQIFTEYQRMKDLNAMKQSKTQKKHSLFKKYSKPKKESLLNDNGLKNSDETKVTQTTQTQNSSKEISVFDGYINEYGHKPKNATHLMRFSKLKNEFKPLTFKEAKNVLSKSKNKNETKSAKDLKPKKSRFWNKKKHKTEPEQIKKITVHKTVEKTVKEGVNIWEINENGSDDSFKAENIINKNERSVINEQTAESFMKQKMGIISPQTVRMKSVFDESSSSEETDRLTVNLKDAKHNVSAHFDVKL